MMVIGFPNIEMMVEAIRTHFLYHMNNIKVSDFYALKSAFSREVTNKSGTLL